ncbi:MAG: putative spore germination protein gerPB [Bacillales bacterium]|jgi:spore germination protein PB|nr:putative spore germination protein gerPB [Bacillales bacterium]
MNFYINQSIIIGQFKIGGVTNSSVLQIGSAGLIKAESRLLNTGSYLAPAPPLISPKQLIQSSTQS